MRAPPPMPPMDAYRPPAPAYRQVICDGSVRPYPGASGLVTELRQQYPAGCNSILIGLMTKAGYGKGRGSPGQVSVVLGLLLPAVQDIDRGGANGLDMQIFKRALAPNGRIGLALAGGGVRQLVGPPTAYAWG